MKKALRLLTLSSCTLLFSTAQAQETFLPFGSEEYHVLDRLETKSGTLSNSLFMGVQPLSRASVAEFISSIKSNAFDSKYSNIDFYNMNRALSISGEYVKPDGLGAITSKVSLGNVFYATQPNAVLYNKDRIMFNLNPVLAAQGMYAKDAGSTGKLLLTGVAGLEGRFKIKNIVSGYISATRHHEELPNYFGDYIQKYEVVPGTAFAPYALKSNGIHSNFWRIRGYVNVPLIPQHINLSLGYDQHFIGDGYRSLFLSNFAEGAAFARINTKIWKLQYQNLYLMLRPQQLLGMPSTTGNKFATVHYLSANITRWLNIGLFESVTFSRDGNYEFGYLNPIIFYRAIERSMGSPDKVAVGFSAKALVKNHFNFYTQILINEFSTKEIFAGNGYYANKWGIQLGAKYYDAFGLKNLDVQVEGNVVRPYTYQHYPNAENYSMANYSSANQALAHPLGAGFAELLVLAQYQPLPKLRLQAKFMYAKQGIDTGAINYGSNILYNYQLPSGEFGVSLINGAAAQTQMVNFLASYELRPRLYIELETTYRNYNVQDNPILNRKTFYVADYTAF
jgi:hypothetical protein